MVSGSHGADVVACHRRHGNLPGASRRSLHVMRPSFLDRMHARDTALYRRWRLDGDHASPDRRSWVLLTHLGGATPCIAAGLLPAIGFAIAGGLLLPHMYVGFKRGRRLESFRGLFPDAIDVIVRGIKSGVPLIDCLKIVAAEAPEPVRSEFKTIVADQTLGLPLGEAVHRLPDRIPVAEASFFAIVVAVQSRTGGNLSEALANLSTVLRLRKKMLSKIASMSAEAKASGGIIGSLPVIVGVVLYFTSPDYIGILFTTLTGNLVLAACAFWMGVGIVVMRQMINFDF